MHIVSKEKFREALRQSGYRSIGELAKSLGIHRNTIHHYLSGNGIFPENFEKVIGVLGVGPEQILVEKKTIIPCEEIAPLVDNLHSEFPEITFILFGSRAEGKGNKYSDWDIGVYCRDRLPHKLYRQMVRRKDDLCENFPFLVDLVNLNRADFSFLKSASRGWKFLVGRQQDWIALQKEVLE